MATTYEIIRNAIMNKEQVTAYYNGHLRELCPHVLGRRNGLHQALFYQFGGGSTTGLKPPGSADNWRCIPLTMLSQVSTHKGPWHTASSYASVRRNCVNEIDVEVSL